MLHGLYWLAANFASRKPTLLVVDDLHWADEPSLRWLAYLARRLEGLPLLLLAGTRPPEQANSPTLVTELFSDPAAVAIRPGNLGPQSAATLARERLGVEPDPSLRRRAADRIRRQPALPGRAARRAPAGGDQSDAGSSDVRDRARTAGDRSRNRDPPGASAGRGDSAPAGRGNARRSNRAAARGRAGAIWSRRRR